MTQAETTDVEFYSGQGVKLVGTIYSPDPDKAHGGALLFCLGFGGTRDGTPVGLSRNLAAEGYTVMSFDYRGFGDSGGTRALLSPADQVDDAVHALEFLAQYPGVDPQQIGLYGTSFGGGIAIIAATRSRHPKALIVSVPVVSGSAWLKSLNRWSEFQAVQERGYAALAHKAVTGEVELVDRADIMIPDPLSREIYTEPIPMSQETVYHVLHHEPIDVAARIRVPVKIFGVEDDSLVPFEQTQWLFDAVTTEKHLTVFPEGNHWAVYEKTLAEVTDGTLSWLADHVMKGNS